MEKEDAMKKYIVSSCLLCLFVTGDVYAECILGNCQKGQGTDISPNGKYVGQWKNGLPYGQGTMAYAEGSNYVGQWKDNKRHGRGTFISANGDKYVGQFKDGDFKGQGTMTFVDGSKYVGQWKDGHRHGQGAFTEANGNKIIGRWENGYQDFGVPDDDLPAKSKSDALVDPFGNGPMSEETKEMWRKATMETVKKWESKQNTAKQNTAPNGKDGK